MNRRKFVTVLCASAALGGAMGSPLASAQAAYPVKPIRVIVPYAPGGVVDVQARAVTDTMQKILGQPIVIEAKPGASGNIGAREVASAAPDGYTLLVSASFLINNPLLETSLPWAPGDFTPVGRFAVSPSYFVVPANSAAQSVKEFADMAAKASPVLQYGNGGTGTPQTMSNELFRVSAGIPLESVMYKGAPPIVPDLINGLVSMAILPSTVAIPQVKAGNLRALANISSSRSPQLPDVPTIAEAGYPDVTTLSWYGLHAPAGTPEPVIRALAAAMKEASATEQVKQRLLTAGGEVAFLDTPDFARFLASDTERWSRLVKIIKQ